MTTWTTPRTWVTGEVLSASNMNTHVRDNMIFYGGTDAMNTTPPGTPGNGQRWVLPVDTTNGVFWHFIYYTTLAQWVFMGGSPLTAYSQTPTGTTSAAYVTAGISVTCTRAGDYLVDLGASMGANTSASAGMISYNIGATGASDNDAVGMGQSSGNNPISHHLRKPKTGIAASTVLLMQQKSLAGGSQFLPEKIFISIQPIKVT